MAYCKRSSPIPAYWAPFDAFSDEARTEAVGVSWVGPPFSIYAVYYGRYAS